MKTKNDSIKPKIEKLKKEAEEYIIQKGYVKCYLEEKNKTWKKVGNCYYISLWKKDMSYFYVFLKCDLYNDAGNLEFWIKTSIV
jgi:hypothetical protein